MCSASGGMEFAALENCIAQSPGKQDPLGLKCIACITCSQVDLIL